jgi:hypothetical protein
LETLLPYEDAAKFNAGALKEMSGLESSVGGTERLCQDVKDLLVKVRPTLECIRDVSIPESTSNTMASILEARAVKEDGEDPLVAAVHRQVTTGFESVFSMLMMHGVPFDADKVTGTYLKDKDGRDIAPKIYLERAHKLPAQMMNFLAERNEKRAAAKARKRSMSGAPSSKAAGSST